MEAIVDVRRLWLMIRGYWVIVVTLGIMGAGGAFSVAKFVLPPEYSATTALLVNRKATGQPGAVQYADQQADVQLIQTFKDIITRPIVLDEVALNLRETGRYQFTTDDLTNMISLSNQTNSQVFSINVKSADSVASKDVANAVAKAFKDKIASIMPVSNVSIVSQARINRVPVGPNVALLTSVGTLVGLIIGVLWALLRELTDATVKDIDYVTDELQLTNLGVIGQIGNVRSLHQSGAEIQVAPDAGSRVTRRQQRG